MRLLRGYAARLIITQLHCNAAATSLCEIDLLPSLSGNVDL